MTAFFEYLEMSRPMAAVARNTAGSNSGALAVLPFVLGLTDLGLGVRDITDFSFRREHNCLSATKRLGTEPLRVMNQCTLSDIGVLENSDAVELRRIGSRSREVRRPREFPCH